MAILPVRFCSVCGTSLTVQDMAAHSWYNPCGETAKTGQKLGDFDDLLLFGPDKAHREEQNHLDRMAR